MSAYIDVSGRYRYWLERTWDAALPRLFTCMLNPAMADAKQNDRTVNQVIKFATRERFGGVRIGNLLAYRTAYPDELLMTDDPVGPEADMWLTDSARKCSDVWIAWGGSFPCELKDRRVTEVVALLREFFPSAMCLGLTACGSPRHPARLADRTPFQRIEWEALKCGA
jgi:hypothetical protein